tara:strand:- start:355 stop:930 length:576 start_codon:yes stop_codon:yes gene_type:complete
MKNYKITKLVCFLCFLLAFASCESNDQVPEPIRIKDFTTVQLLQLHGASEKSWKLTEIILPEEFRDYPASINKACVADDTYTFPAPTSALFRSTEEIKIELGDIRCFETFSEAEHFEGTIRYDPYTLNGVEVMKTTLYLESCSIADNDPVGTTSWCFGDLYPLVELTEDRMVFSNAIFIGNQNFGYVFERN